MRFTFKKQQDKNNQFDTTDVTVESDGVTLDVILSDFADFLRGCGFQIDGDLDVVKDEE